MHFGEGLVHSNNYSFNQMTTNNHTLRLNKSSSKFNYQLGIASIFKVGISTTTIALGYNPISGNIVNNKIESFTSVESYNTRHILHRVYNSYHRNVCVSSKIELNRIIINVNGKFTSLKNTYYPAEKYYNTFYSLPKKFGNFSLSYSFSNDNSILHGELATSSNRGIATTHFLKYHLNENLEWNNNLRFFSKDYQSINSNPYSSNNRTQNEIGFSTELIYNTYSVQLSSRFNIVKSNFSKYHFHLPSLRKSLNNRLRIQLTDSIKIDFKYQLKSGDIELKKDHLHYLKKKNEHRIMSNIKYIITDMISLNTRIGFNYIKSLSTSSGYTIAQDITMKSAKHKLTLRCSVTNAPTWDNRFYLYEYDLLHNFSIPVYYHKSTRFYLNYNYKINEFWNLWMKYEMSYYSDKEYIGSGSNKILSNLKSQLKMQVRYKF